MGYYAARSAVLLAARLELGPQAARLLNLMALECLDEESHGRLPRRFYGGRELSAIALGFLAPENGSDRAHQAVKRAMRELVDKGAVTRTRSGGNGRAAEFELNLMSLRPPRPRTPAPAD